MALKDRKEELTAVAREFFTKIMALSNEVRQDDKTRTGIAVFVWKQFTADLINIEIGEASDPAKFFVHEKAVRSSLNGELSSRDSADAENFRFPGSITMTDKNGNTWVVSISGIKGSEDEAGSILVMSKVAKCTIQEVLENLDSVHSILPDFASDGDHYLSKVIGYKVPIG